MSLWGCASAPPQNTAIHHLIEKDVGEVDRGFVANVISESAAHPSRAQRKAEGELKRKVSWWLHYFTVRDRERFKRNLDRGENYRALVQEILWQEKLPPELYYLALIESGYVMHATSTTEAVGIWQFMKPTAVTYGLSVDPLWDERQHPIAATYAAAHYLESLHKKFNSWYMAIAAYNAGQGRIARAEREGNSNDFWFLAEHGFIPSETMDYIPKFLAAATIGANLEKFGFNSSPPTGPRWPELTSVYIKPGTRFSSVVHTSKLSERELLHLNPSLKRALVFHYPKRIRIWVPKTCAERFSARKTTLARSN